MGFINIIILAILYLGSFWSAWAQTIGVDLCACQPSVVTFQLNFTLDCDGTNVAGPGINETSCIPESRTSLNVSDFVPTFISEVQVLELDENLAPLTGAIYTDGYFDGDEITYTSIVETDPDNVTTSNFPLGFQVVLTGLNAAEQNIVITMAITYFGGMHFTSQIISLGLVVLLLTLTNILFLDCGIFPLLEVGEQIGPIVFVSNACIVCLFGTWAFTGSLMYLN